jgi:MinD-like ATPase involved in chromosome partitioning or flagellar assembly
MLDQAEAEIVMIDAGLARADSDRFLDTLDRLGRAIVVILLPADPELRDLELPLSRHPKVREVLHQPVNPQQAVQCAERHARAERERLYNQDPVGHRAVVEGRAAARRAATRTYPQTTITVTSVKGGPGKSVLAQGLWYAINYHGLGPAVLISMDVPDVHILRLSKNGELKPYPNMGVFLGRSPDRPAKLALQESTQWYRIRGQDAPIIPALADHGQLQGLEQAQFQELIAAAKSGYGVVILDTPPGVCPETMAAIEESSRVVLVMTADEGDVQCIATGLQAYGVNGADSAVPRERFGYVMNRVDGTEPGGNLDARGVEDRLRAELGWFPPLLAVVPYAPYVTYCHNAHQPVYAHEGPVTAAVDELLGQFFARWNEDLPAQKSRQRPLSWLPRVRVA